MAYVMAFLFIEAVRSVALRSQTQTPDHHIQPYGQRQSSHRIAMVMAMGCYHHVTAHSRAQR